MISPGATVDLTGWLNCVFVQPKVEMGVEFEMKALLEANLINSHIHKVYEAEEVYALHSKR